MTASIEAYEAKLWRTVERQLGQAVPAAIRAEARRAFPEFVDALGGEEPMATERLIRYVSTGLAFWELREKAGVLPELAPSPRLPRSLPAEPMEANEYDELRGKAVSAMLARRLGETDDVQGFRGTVLGGRTLTEPEADRFLRSPAIRFLTREDFAVRGIPITDHRSKEIEREAQPFAPYSVEEALAEIRQATAEGRTPFEGKTPPRVVAPQPWTRLLQIEWNGSAVEELFTCEFLAQGKDDRLPIPTANGFWEMHPAWRGSIGSQLSRVANNITIAYPWSPSAAVWFVLTDQAPDIPIWSGQIHRAMGYAGPWQSIELRVQPWVNPRVVAEAYQGLQREALRKLGELGQPPKPFEPPKRGKPELVRMFLFVLDRLDRWDSDPDFDRLRGEWNAANPRVKFASPFAMRQAYERVRQTFIEALEWAYEMPETVFDPGRRQNYNVDPDTGERVYDDVPPGFEFDDNGALHPISASKEGTP